MTQQNHKNALVLMLLAVALVSLVPTLTIADAQKQTGAVGINASGQAMPIGQGKGTPSSAMLVLNGTLQSDGNGELKINGLTGSLLIGLVNYTIAGGQGQINNKGEAQINGKTSGGKGKDELVLHGTIQGGNVAFDSHESKLSSLFFLSLTGHASITLNTLSSTSKSKGEGEDETNHTNQTVTQTIFVTVLSTVNHNFTTTQQVTQQNNITVTLTKTVNATITVSTTQTIANSTITKIVTTTVANTTITTTVTNSTHT